MKHSIGKAFTSGSIQLIFEVPAGYVAHVDLVYITNTSGSTGTYTIDWRHADNSYADIIRFAYGKSLGSGNSDQFSNGLLVMKSNDRMYVNPSMAVDVIVSFDLLKAPPLYSFDGE